jgi:urease gamma subunit
MLGRNRLGTTKLGSTGVSAPTTSYQGATWGHPFVWGRFNWGANPDIYTEPSHIKYGELTMESVSALAVAARAIYSSGAASFTSSAALAITAQKILTGAIDLSSSATLVAAAKSILNGELSMESVSELLVSSSAIHKAALSMESSSALVVVASRILLGELALESSASLSLLVKKLLYGELTMESVSALVVSTGTTFLAELSMSSSATMIASASAIYSGKVPMEAASSLLATASAIWKSNSVSMSASSALVLAAKAIKKAEFDPSSSASLVALANKILLGDVELESISSLLVAASALRLGEATMQSVSSLLANARFIVHPSVSMSSSASLSVAASALLLGHVALESSASLSILAKKILSGELSMQAVSSMLASPFEVAMPIVVTKAATRIHRTDATGNGFISEGIPITNYGICWKKGSDPVNIAGSDGYTSEGAGVLGYFSSIATGLDADSTYYFRAYATNTQGTAYGSALTFVTAAAVRGRDSSLDWLAIWAGIDAEVIDVAKRGVSDPSPTCIVTVVGDLIAPNAPVIAATGVAEAVRLAITLPTLSEDGSACNDLKWLVIYYRSAAGIDVTNPATYDGTVTISPNSEWTDSNFSTSGTVRYYRIVALDISGNESDPSNEVNATTTGSSIDCDIPDVATGLVFNGNPKVGDGMLGLLLKNPGSSWVGFLNYEIQYALSTDSGGSWGAWTALTKTAGGGYVHKGLTTTSLYRYKYRGRPVGADGNGSSTWDESNNGGTGWPNGGSWAADNSTLVAELVLAETIISTGEVRGDHFKATSYLAIGASSTFGTQGIQLQYNSGTPRFYVGDGANAFLNFDGTKLTWKAANTELDASGNLTIGGGAVGGFTISVTDGLYAGTGVTRVQMKPGAGFWAGATAIGDAPFSVTQAGALKATSGTIGGFTISSTTLTAGTGGTAVGIAPATYPFYAGSATASIAPFRVSAAGALIATSATITGAITASSGTIGGFTIGASALTAGTGGTAVGIAPATYPFYAGSATAASAPFRVTAAGILYATGATISGTITCGAGSSYSGLGSIATLNSIGASNCDTTIISGGKIITGLLTASNITTGTLNASLITVTNLSATSITTGTLNFSSVGRSSLSVLVGELAGGITYDKIASISATTITTGTLTGRNIATASSGARAVMDATGTWSGVHTFGIYDASRLRLYITDSIIYGADISGNQTVRINNISSGSYMAGFMQLSVTAAIPTLSLQQSDTSEGFIDFIGTTRSVITTSTTNSEGSLRIEVNGVVKRIPYFVNDSG